MQCKLYFTLLFFLFLTDLPADVLEVGSGRTYADLSSAVNDVTPGDTILIYEGTYNGGIYLGELRGRPDTMIKIHAAEDGTVIFSGGNTAIQLTNAAYVQLRGLVFEQQIHNGVNIDDGGDYSTPSTDIIIENCTFRDINATANNDLLKMSGVDNFEIRDCTFANGSPGGSGIDMVGCHQGVITNNSFMNMGFNAIQAKGGSQYIRIEANYFEDCGFRSLNLGGSTGYQYIRPDNATFEAADLQVYSNIFIGSSAPVAYVGCINVIVANNTLISPANWAVRILQETVDPDRFIECGDNFFLNNIIYQGNIGSTINIGANTRPETFTFAGNLWYNYEDANWPGPNLPVADTAIVIGEDPLFVNSTELDFNLQSESPALGKAFDIVEPQRDYFGNAYNNPRSLGAIEGNPDVSRIQRSGSAGPEAFELFQNFPNPFNASTQISYNIDRPAVVKLTIYDLLGRSVWSIVSKKVVAGVYSEIWNSANNFGQAVPSGMYFYDLKIDGILRAAKKMILIK